MNKQLLSLLFAITISINIWSSSISFGGFWYDLDLNNHTASVTYKGSRYDAYADEYQGNIVIPSSFIYHDGSIFTVTSIGEYAFCDCRGVTSVTIPESITRIDGSAFSNCDGITSVTINSDSITSKTYTTSSNIGTIFGSQVTEYVIGDSIKNIGEYAFSACNITSITIPVNVTEIGNYAFSNCNYLTSVNINSNSVVGRPYNSGSTHYNLSTIFGLQVTEYTIGIGVTSIGKSAFSSSRITNINIPDGVRSIGQSAFASCTSLNSVSMPNSLMYIDDGAFWGCVKLISIDIPDGVTKLASNIFKKSGLTKITLPNRLKSIGTSAFEDCSLKSIIIPDSVTNIGTAAFSGCRYLTSVIIGSNSIKKIEKSVFSGCTSLQSISIPNGVTSIGENAFYFCTSLTDISIPSSVKNIDYDAFYNCKIQNLYITDIAAWCNINVSSAPRASHLYVNNVEIIDLVIPEGVTKIGNLSFCNCSRLKSVTIPNSVTSIGRSAFRACRGLTSVNIGNSVTSIGDNAFDYCDKLTSVSIPNSVTSIGSGAFGSCYGLTSVNIGNSVTSIGDNAFNLCTNLREIKVFMLTPPVINNNVFEKCGENEELLSITCYVPRKAYLAYLQADVWKEFNLSPFDLPTYSITVSAQNGSVTGAGTYDEGSSITLTATANNGYHFTQWNDGNTDNPRTIVLTKDTTFTAEFAINTYTLSVSCNATQGQIEGTSGVYEHGTEHVFKAIPNEGYHFAQWNDGNTDNPRTIVLTKDTTLTAEFAINTYIVQFFGFNSMLIDRQSVDHGANAVAPEAPQVEHYDFVGWDKDFSNVQSNLDVYAQYVKNTEAIDNIETTSTPCKVIDNGTILILRGEKTYSITGSEIR